MATDPEIGEVIWAIANMYGKTLDTWAGSSQQVMDVLNGDITLSQLVAGKDMKDYVQDNLNATDPRRPASGPEADAALTTAPVAPSFHRTVTDSGRRAVTDRARA